jgi:hypothetical protein
MVSNELVFRPKFIHNNLLLLKLEELRKLDYLDISQHFLKQFKISSNNKS